MKIVTQELIENKIYLLRGQKVMFDRDLAALYGVSTGNLNKAVKRKIKRFPEDFIFQINKTEHKSLVFQIGISKKGRGGTRFAPYAFTEHGIAMLSSVLNSERAIQVNIAIMRAFVRIRHLIDGNREFAQKLSQLQRKYEHHDYQIQRLFDEFRKLSLPVFKEKDVRVKGFDKKGD
ncbi:MAG: ORF6N domain-containing protein [Endomicrobiales bacterium]|nr:ORF6N domain-containing protein [Endomicrobiales bacterium]